MLLVAQFFVDESGYVGQGPAIVMAGLWTSAERWAEFSTAWDAALRAERPIRVFKMREAAGLNGAFYGFSVEQRDAKLRSLAEIMTRHAFRALYVTVATAPSLEYPQFKKATAGPLEKPWFWAFHYFIQMATLEIYKVGIREPFEIIFDENKKLGPKARHFYPFMRYLIPNEPRSIAPVDPMFRTDEHTLPLQAADMIAWLQLQRISGRPHEFGWLDSAFANLKCSEFSLDVAHMPKDMAISRTIEEDRNLDIPDDAIAELLTVLEYYGYKD